jgi:hypothetical protein
VGLGDLDPDSVVESVAVEEVAFNEDIDGRVIAVS